MRSIKTAVLAGAFTAAASAAMAADLPSRVLPSVPVVKEDPESWYLRGDVGFVNHMRPNTTFADAPFSGDFDYERIENTGLAGIGVGYRFSPHFRADLTLDHRFASAFRGAGTATRPGEEGAVLSRGVSDKGLLQSSALMVNGYLDLGTAGGFTPYVGAGIGVAHNILSHYTRVIPGAATVNEDTGEAIAAAPANLAGGSRYSFAWALMAGFGYQVASNLTLDVGYRYMNLGDVKTRNHEAGTGVNVDNIGSHEVRVGLRYAFP